MPCLKCGAEIIDGQRFCRICGVPVEPDAAAAAKHLTPAAVPLLADLTERLARLARWDEPSLEGAFQEVIAAQGVKLGVLAQPVRVAVTGGTVSPGIYEVLAVLGRERTLARLRAASSRLGGPPRP